MSRFEPEEVEAALTHELGHHVAGDVWRGLAVQGAVTLAAFWVADRALAAGAGALGLSGPADIAGLPLLGLVAMAVILIALPVVNGWFRRVETRADGFALSFTRAPGPIHRGHGTAGRPQSWGARPTFFEGAALVFPRIGGSTHRPREKSSVVRRLTLYDLLR